MNLYLTCLSDHLQAESKAKVEERFGTHALHIVYLGPLNRDWGGGFQVEDREASLWALDRFLLPPRNVEAAIVDVEDPILSYWLVAALMAHKIEVFGPVRVWRQNGPELLGFSPYNHAFYQNPRQI